MAKNVGSLVFSLHQKKILHKTFHKYSSYTETDNAWSGRRMFGGMGFLAIQSIGKVLNLVQVLKWDSSSWDLWELVMFLFALAQEIFALT